MACGSPNHFERRLNKFWGSLYGYSVGHALKKLSKKVFLPCKILIWRFWVSHDPGGPGITRKLRPFLTKLI